MRKMVGILMVLVMAFALGCGVAQDTKIKCPKCGAVFTVDEGIEEIRKKGY